MSKHNRGRDNEPFCNGTLQQIPPSPPTVHPLTYSLAEAAAVLGVGETLMRELVRTGRVPVLRLGRRVLVRRASLEQILADAEQEGSNGGGAA